MKTFRLIAYISSFVASIGIIFCCSSCSNDNKKFDYEKQGYQSLFDGTSLENWTLIETSENKNYNARWENFLIGNGALLCAQSPDRKGAALRTNKAFGDFELVMEIRPDWGCDSGIFIRSNKYGECIQIMNDYIENGAVGYVFGQGTGGYISRPIRLHGVPEKENPTNVVATDYYNGVEIDNLLYAIKAEQWNKIWKNHDWNIIKIRCIGTEPKITTWINGTKIMEMDGLTYTGRHLKDENKGKLNGPTAWDRDAIRGKIGDKGYIGVQVHPGRRWAKNGYSRYRNIWIKEL